MVKNHDPKNEMQDMLTPLDAEEAAKTKLRLDMREIPKSSINVLIRTTFSIFYRC